MATLIIPDVNDRTVNSPAILVNSKTILNIYNYNKNLKLPKINQDILDWFKEVSKTYMWDEVIQYGHDVLLVAKIVMVQNN